jgi:glucose-1-phosphate adenylyltransferase
MERVFILTQFNSLSLHRHVVSTYKFDPFSKGFVDILAAQQTPGDSSWFQGTADAVRQNLRFITERKGELELILSGDHIYRMDYRQLLATHEENDAAITIAVLPCSEEDIAGFGAVRVDDEGRVVEFREKPATPEAREGMRCGPDPERPYLASMGIYLFDERTLIEGLSGDAVDFGRDVLPAAVGTCRVQAHIFDGYWRDIGTIGSFYEAHLDLVRDEPGFNFYDPDWVIYTHPRYLPGARLHDVRIVHSLLSDGVHCRSCTIENSVIGIRSNIQKAEVRDSLIMGADEDYPEYSGAPPVGIGEGSVIERAIVDKNARIGKGVRIVNEAGVGESEGEGYAIHDGIVVVPKNAVVPDGTVI